MNPIYKIGALKPHQFSYGISGGIESTNKKTRKERKQTKQNLQTAP